MNNKNLITSGAAAIVAVIAISGFAFASFAADETSDETSDSNFFPRMGMHRDLSEDEIAEFEAMHEERQAERDAYREEMDTAIESGYDAWASLVAETRGDDAQILEVINESNFSNFKAAHDKIYEGHELIEEGRDEMEELGVERRMGEGFGGGMKRGGGFRMHMMGN